MLAAAGCGTRTETGAPGTSTGSTAPASKAEYEESITEIMGGVISASEELQTASSGAPDFKARAPFLETAATAYGAAGDSLDDLTPPAEVKALHQKLIDASRGLAVATQKAAAGAKKGDSKAADAFNKAVQKYQADLTTIQGEFAALGYQFPAGEEGTGTTTAPTTPTTPTVPTTPTTPGTSTTPTTPSTVPTVPTTPTTPTTPPDTSTLPDPKDLEKSETPQAGNSKN
jgi:hypothetical protein